MRKENITIRLLASVYFQKNRPNKISQTVYFRLKNKDEKILHTNLYTNVPQL